MKNQTISLIIVALILSSCGKDIELLNKFKSSKFNFPEGATCENGDRLFWQWQQPEPTTSHSVDLLFVADTSLSLMGERSRLAESIPHFLSALPADADVRIGVMLAHGTENWSGRLFSKDGIAVINPKTMTLEAAQAALSKNLSCPPLDWGFGNGEMLLYSLQRSLEADRYSEIRQKGFFRDGASLSVVFLSDENDPCFDPRAHGYTSFPDLNESWLGLEKIAYHQYCIDPATKALVVSPQSVMTKLLNRFPGKKISMGAVVHSDPSHVDFSCNESSIGHGLLETVSQTSDGVVMDITSGDYSAGLRQLASVSTSQLALMTQFPLDAPTGIDPQSILIAVDGNLVNGTYDGGTQSVTIQGTDAGSAHSQVYITACPATPTL